MTTTPSTSRGRIAAWRDEHPGTRLTAAILRDILDLSTLRGADLGGADLRGADLYGADLRGADLRGADLGGANLYGADLGGANLRGADLYGADLGGANLRGADLYGADLGGANLYGADLYGADLYGADLGGANLRGADLGGADLRGADLRGAYLGGANLYGADLGGAYGLPALTVSGLPSGDLTLIPTPESGWYLRVGCWSGTVDELAALVAQDTDWPEARGSEVDRRRPGLEAAIALARAHIALYPDAVEQVTRARAEWEAEKANRATDTTETEETTS